MILPERMVFICGFSRGGTAWLRNCIGVHPDIHEIIGELALFRDFGTREAIIREMSKHQCCPSCSSHYIEKSPGNSPHLPKALKLLPEAKYLFIIRDPRDAFVSHRRATAAWTEGANNTVQGCLGRLEKYYRGYESVRGNRQVFLARYEDLHLRFDTTLTALFDFIGVPSGPDLIAQSFKRNSFFTRTGRMPGDEVRSDHRRKGIIGDWRNHLDSKEASWIRHSDFWRTFMAEHGYVME